MVHASRLDQYLHPITYNLYQTKPSMDQMQFVLLTCSGQFVSRETENTWLWKYCIDMVHSGTSFKIIVPSSPSTTNLQYAIKFEVCGILGHTC